MTSFYITPGSVTHIPIGELVPDPTQPRKAFPAKPLQDLANNIKARGIRQPITVIATAGGVVIKTGERRWQAAKLAGLETVPCLLDPDAGDEPQRDDAARLIDQIAENDLREGLNPMERAEALGRMQDEGLTPKDISEILAKHGMHMARPTVSNLLRLRKLPDGVQELVRSGRLRESYARDLLQFTEYPKLLNAFVEEAKQLGDDPLGKLDFAEALDGALNEHAAAYLGSHDVKRLGCTNCKCLVTVPDNTWGAGGTSTWCLDKKAHDAKLAATVKSGTSFKQEGTDKPKEKPEIDPTKVTPRKVSPNKEGIVALSRRSHETYRRLDSDNTGFDKSDCDGCPHQHVASYNGGKATATETCFYTPCFDHLQRQQGRINNRAQRIREIIDDQLTPHLVEVAASDPVSGAIVLPLLAYVAAQYPVSPSALEHDAYRRAEPSWRDDRSSSAMLRGLPTVVKRGTLTAWLETELTTIDEESAVKAVIASLHMEQRRELALYLSINIGSFWRNTDDYAKLFTKPEIVAMIGDAYEPPDVPAGQWRQRLVDTGGIPDLVREIYTGPIANHATPLDIDEEDGRTCRSCGCSEMDACVDEDGPCAWAEEPGVDGQGLCTRCAKAAA